MMLVGGGGVCAYTCVCAFVHMCVNMLVYVCMFSILTTSLHESFTSIPKYSEKALDLRDYNKTAIMHA